VKTNVYIDGFNLYYRALKGTSYKWLNLDTLCRLLLPGHQINQIKYYTARVSARPHDPGQPTRQQMYLRALGTLPNVSIIFGTFLTNEIRALRADTPGRIEYVKVFKTEEKGSDVNLASHLLHDGFRKDYEQAVVITNDSDLVEPIRIVRRELGFPVGILNPSHRPNPLLVREATFIKPIRKGVLQASQFPTTLTDRAGTFHKPTSW
jgi:uncharacterized LabA/DUF88 family protein